MRNQKSKKADKKTSDNAIKVKTRIKAGGGGGGMWS